MQEAIVRALANVTNIAVDRIRIVQIGSSVLASSATSSIRSSRILSSISTEHTRRLTSDVGVDVKFEISYPPDDTADSTLSQAAAEAEASKVMEQVRQVNIQDFNSAMRGQNYPSVSTNSKLIAALKSSSGHVVVNDDNKTAGGSTSGTLLLAFVGVVVVAVVGVVVWNRMHSDKQGDYTAEQVDSSAGSKSEEGKVKTTENNKFLV
jgi:hypothetical protein